MLRESHKLVELPESLPDPPGLWMVLRKLVESFQRRWGRVLILFDHQAVEPLLHGVDLMVKARSGAAGMTECGKKALVE